MSDGTESAPARAPAGEFRILATVVWALMGLARRPRLTLRVLALPIDLSVLAFAIGWLAGLPALKTIVGLLAGLAMLPVIVFWHRYAAFGEPPSQPPVLPRITKREWRYLLDMIVIAGVSLPILLVVVPITALLSFHLDLQDTASRIEVLLAYVIYIGQFALLMYVMSRVGLILPATALDQRIGLGEAFRRSRPLALRLTVALWLTCLPVVLVNLVAALSMGLSFTEMGVMMSGRMTGPIAIVVFFIFLHIVISYLLALASAAILTRAFMAAPGFRTVGVDADSSPH